MNKDIEQLKVIDRERLEKVIEGDDRWITNSYYDVHSQELSVLQNGVCCGMRDYRIASSTRQV